MAEDYYKTLGVKRDASQAEIQKAYREMARKHHPDMNPDDKNAKRKFQQIQAAFDVLNDREKRENYDRYGSAFEGASGRPPRGWPPGNQTPGGETEFHFDDDSFAQVFGDRMSGGAPEGLGDIFRHFQEAAGAKTRRGGGAARRGADIAAETEIPFQVAVTGGEVQLSIPKATGKVDTLTVKIPAGIEDGKKIRLRGQGEPGGRKGAPGDLLITVHVAPHSSFQRQGNQLYVKVPVTLAEAALGAKVDVPTPTGVVSLRIPAGTSSGTKLRIKGRGVPSHNGEGGDLLAEVQIVIPKDLATTEQQLIEDLDHRHPMNPRAKLRW
jgi:DnaJ-class molecular chaperone